MKALSVKQPWARLICSGHKDIENRCWGTGFRGRIFVHAGKIQDSAYGFRSAFDTLRRLHGQSDAEIIWQNFWQNTTEGAYGAIIGEVDITDCVTQSESPWFVGPYGFVLANPVLYEKPFSCRGYLGFFKPVLLKPYSPIMGAKIEN